ncbi:MAG: tRNA (N6-threonylcarbamoyladenosine(37)-N6)-methyltransferase TrmO [Lentisphaeria bacterium]|nr:tRNA (N6-threonylcarbamoyladenosine(37)-N6)-methyltransferase TrmO [Lentisphaeria bacterium]
MSEEITESITAFPFKAIGYVRTSSRYRYEMPRQASFSGVPAFIEWVKDEPGYALAAKDLAGFERIWVIFCFHLNWDHWNPMVRPPVSPDGKKYSLFATRSPHRPNPIGLSCVQLVSVEKTGLLIGPCDILDGTPVFDIKPYIPEADAFPASAAGWHDRIKDTGYEVSFTENFLAKSRFLAELSSLDVENFCRIQLKFSPLDASRKRVKKAEGMEKEYIISCRTWKVCFHIEEEKKEILVKDLFSNYKSEELLPGSPDKYGDKDFHRAFLAAFPSL